jgi:cytochrome c553
VSYIAPGLHFEGPLPECPPQAVDILFASMRRWLLIFLLVLLPFQFSWASASAYCQHERDTQPEHWGHHESETRGTDRSHSGEGAQKNSSTQPNAVVGECAVCHAGYAQHADASVAPVLAAVHVTQALRAMPAERFASHISDVPLRPDWSLAL